METYALPSLSLKDVVDRILSSRQITRVDQRLLLSLSSQNLEERTLLNQVFDRLHRGLLRVVD